MPIIERNLQDEEGFDRYWIEQIILELADAFEIRVQWDKTTAVVTTVFALAGGVIGGYAGGRVGAAIGAGVGGAGGFAMASLRGIWHVIREKQEELIYIVYNYMRRLDPIDFVRSFDMLMHCPRSKQELVRTIVEFLADKLQRLVVSRLSIA